MALQSVEPAAPEVAVGAEPGVELGERLGAQAVPAPLSVGPHLDEPGLTQHPQVLRHAGLAEPEVLDQLADGPLALPEQVEDLPARGLG